MNWYLTVLKKYAVFTGRARRSEYWYFVLFNIIAGIVLGIIDAMTGTVNAVTGLGLLGGIYSLAVLIPSLAVAVRRLHDTDRSGWWLLLVFVPLVGWIALVIFAVLEGTSGANRFGEDPKTS